MKTKKHVYAYFVILFFLLMFTSYMIGKSLIASKTITIFTKYASPKQGWIGTGTDIVEASTGASIEDAQDPLKQEGSKSEVNKEGSSIGHDNSEPAFETVPLPVKDTEAEPGTGTNPANEAENGKKDTADRDVSESTEPSSENQTTPSPLPPSSTVMRYLPGHSATNKTVALTFDDGPDNKYTEQILDILNHYEIKATFFLVGIQIERFPDIVKRIAEEGHDIGNHSWSHAKFSELSKEQMVQEIRKTNEFIESITGQSTNLFRAPYGDTTASVMAQIVQEEQHTIGWSVDTKDWNGTTPEEMMDILKRQLQPGGIILQHSFGGKNGNLDNTIEVLPLMIEYLIKEGYHFLTVTEALNSVTPSTDPDPDFKIKA